MVSKAEPELRAKTSTVRSRRSPCSFAKQVGAGVLKNECMGSAAQIAYYLLFATFPLLLSLTSLPAFLPIPNLAVWLLGLLAAIAPSEAVDLMRVSAQRSGKNWRFSPLSVRWAPRLADPSGSCERAPRPVL